MPGPYNVQVGDVITTGQYLTDGQGNTSGLAIKSDGNVGVGTTSPALKLHVSGGSFGAYGAADGTGVRIDGGASGTMVKLFSDYLSGSDIKLHFSTYGHRDDDGGITIDTAGKVGIGTTSPGANLHVKAAASASATLRIDAPTDGYDSYAFFSQNNVTKGMIGFDDSDDVFKVARNFDNVDICISSTGNVGIGVSNPGAKLAVNGIIEASDDVKIGTLTVPDYVFEQDYKLRSLDETRQFIAQHKHLPDVPSATEYMDAGGVMIGKLNELLLRKIEELTLHLIMQEERINGQQERINELEALTSPKSTHS